MVGHELDLVGIKKKATSHNHTTEINPAFL